MLTAKLHRIGRLLRFRPWRILAGSLVLLVLVGLVGLYEQRHVSADLRRTLMVAVAPESPDSLVLQSAGEAKMHLHTWRDRREYAKLQHAMELLAAARTTEVQLAGRLKQSQAELDVEIHSEKLMIVTEMAYLESHQPMPAGLADDVVREQQHRERARDQQRQADEGAWLQLLQERLDARVLMQELRVDLGLA